MTPTDLLTDAFERVHEGTQAVLDGLTDDQLRHRPGPDANPIGWLVWHLLRVQDDHVAGVGGHDQVYGDFVDRFDLPYGPVEHGYGHTSEDVAAFRAPAALLAEYATAVHERTLAYLATLGPDDLDRVVDERWDPPVTLGVRLVSVVNDDTQHVGQAAYVRGLLGL
ncbi:mycothiol transferase [Nocardioides rubriscoriae]|uniref:mycothiol transferase n=1 Tax=Nocardioides rubriscoriae TaxID=642762 RepID=UPI0011E00EA1|nr:DinB family protein [Nocardioides rubriscoriae]